MLNVSTVFISVRGFIRTFIYFIRAFFDSFFLSYNFFVSSFVHPPVRPCVRASVRPCVRASIHLFIISSVLLLVCSFGSSASRSVIVCLRLCVATAELVNGLSLTGSDDNVNLFVSPDSPISMTLTRKSDCIFLMTSRTAGNPSK